MAYEYTIDAGVNWLPLAGYENLRRTLRQAAADIFTMQRTSATALTDAALFSYDQVISIRRDSTVLFTGRIATLPRIGDHQDERQLVTIEGPWADLNAITYQQSWKSYNIGDEDEETITKTRVILGLKTDGTRATAGEVISDAVTWAISRGANLQIGTVTGGPQLPLDERSNVSCSEVILTVLRWLPDYTSWIDYSTTPPTFNAVRRSALSNVSVSMLDGDSIQVTPRSDLQVPGIVIQYEKTHSSGGQTWTTVEEDTAGSTSHRRTVHMSFDLAGSRRTFVKARVETAAFPDGLAVDYPNNTACKAFLKTLFPAFADVPDADITISDIDSSSALPRFVTAGSIPDWLTSVDAEQATVNITLGYSLRIAYPAGDVIKSVDAETISVSVTATDASSATYKRTASYDSGESTPTGVAAQIYAAWSVLHYEGSISLTDVEPTESVTPGKLLRITNGLAALATMDAAIQQVSTSFDDGVVNISFGPPRQIEADTLVALFRALRTRRYAWSAGQKTSASAEDESTLDLSEQGPLSDSSVREGLTQRLRLRANDGTYDQEIDLDPLAVAHAEPGDAAARILKPVELLALYLDGSVLKYRKVQVLASAMYGTGVAIRQLPTGTNGQILVHNGTDFAAATPADVNALTNFQVDEANKKLQVKTTALKVISAAAESAWTDKHTGDEC